MRLGERDESGLGCEHVSPAVGVLLLLPSLRVAVVAWLRLSR